MSTRIHLIASLLVFTLMACGGKGSDGSSQGSEVNKNDTNQPDKTATATKQGDTKSGETTKTGDTKTADTKKGAAEGQDCGGSTGIECASGLVCEEAVSEGEDSTSAKADTTPAPLPPGKCIKDPCPPGTQSPECAEPTVENSSSD